MIRCLAKLIGATMLLAGCASAPPPAPAPQPAPNRGLFPSELVQYYDVDHPSDACLSDQELRSELLVRLRNDLMVSSLTCRQAFGGQQAFLDYVNFTTVHQQPIRTSQEVLGSFLGRYIGGSRARLFDTYITEMANVESQTVIAMGPARYCAARRQQFSQAVDFDRAGLERYLDEAVNRFRGEYNMCNPQPENPSGDYIEVDGGEPAPDDTSDSTAAAPRMSLPVGG